VAVFAACVTVSPDAVAMAGAVCDAVVKPEAQHARVPKPNARRVGDARILSFAARITMLLGSQSARARTIGAGSLSLEEPILIQSERRAEGRCLHR